MQSQRPRLARSFLIGILACPLLGTGPCLEITQNSIISGFFDATTLLLLEYAESQLPNGGDETESTDDTGNM